MNSSHHPQGLDILRPVFAADRDAIGADSMLLLCESELLAAVFALEKLTEKEENRCQQSSENVAALAPLLPA